MTRPSTIGGQDSGSDAWSWRRAEIPSGNGHAAGPRAENNRPDLQPSDEVDAVGLRALDLWTDDFVWEGDESDLPGSGRHEGKQAAIDVLQETVGVWDTFELSADEFIEQADTVDVLGHFDVAKGDQSGRLPVVHIWYASRGRLNAAISNPTASNLYCRLVI